MANRKSMPGDSVKISAQQVAEQRDAAAVAANNVADSELLVGGGVQVYGGLNSRDQINSFIGQYNKYYKSITNGRSRFGDNQVNNRMFNQLMIMDRNTLQQIQPFISGRFIFVPGQMPRMMEMLHPEETDYVRRLFQSTVISITGFAEKRLEMGQVKAMTEQNSYEVVTKQTGVTTELNFTFMTLLQGLPMYKYFTTWMQYVYDPGSGAAVYPYYTTLEYHEGNHTMNGVYAIVDPSFQLVEEGAILYSMIPKGNGANTILDQTWGEHNVSQYQVQFKVHTLPGGMPQVLGICQAVLADFQAGVELNSYWVNPADSYGSGENTMGLGADILHEDGREALAQFNEASRSQ